MAKPSFHAAGSERRDKIGAYATCPPEEKIKADALKPDSDAGIVPVTTCPCGAASAGSTMPSKTIVDRPDTESRAMEAWPGERICAS